MANVHFTVAKWVAFTQLDNLSWVERVGAVAPTLVTEAKNANLIVIAAPHNMDSVDALHAAIFNTHRPVLFVPTQMPVPTDLGRHLAIAWKPCSQARRAILGALPWLRAASTVSVVAVDEPSITPNTPEAIKLLASYGIIAHAIHLRTAPGEHVADRLLQELGVLRANALVMGAYRFGELVEWIFGGVTREILHRSRLPVFLSH
ncbi:hypothetical protein BA190_08470 [Labrys sp. WJW]|nr:hypothetical protein BA190_08470 [Labrys sp. WJW]